MQRILISGASGLIGSALVPALESRGNALFRLVRREPSKPNEVQWDPMQSIAPKLVSGYDAVIHLSGENVAGRWSADKKRRIRDSRVISTQNLARALAEAEAKPRVFLCASAIGYYSDRGDETLTEQSAPGKGFLPEVCREWEGATAPASEAGIRVVNLRIGIVLSRNGGALKQMLLPFRLGLGGRVGSGRQSWSWIHMDDLVAAVLHLIEHAGVSGGVNIVSPNPVTNMEFTNTLARILRRPAILPLPTFAARAAFGEFAKEGLLASARVLPHRLLQAGFQFRYPALDAAFKSLL
jgi:uncharacterized protein (TIGR01777 family)